MKDTKATLPEYDPLGANLQDPHSYFKIAREVEPVFHSKEIGAWVVTRYEDVREILSDTTSFSSANALKPVGEVHPQAAAELAKGYWPPLPKSIEADGDEHKRLRAPFSAGFTKSRVKKVEPYIRQHANALIDSFIDDGRVEFMSRYGELLPTDVVLKVYGLTSAERDAAQESSHARFQFLSVGTLNLEGQMEAARYYLDFQKTMARHVLDRRESPRDDLISEVTQAYAPEPGPLTDHQVNEIQENLTANLLAANIPISHALGNGMRSLLSHRDQWNLLCERPELIPNAMEEILRYESPVSGMFRVSTREVELAGQKFPAGTEFLLAYMSANRDEDQFDQADDFDITRSPCRHMSFAEGKHACAGSFMARTQLQITLELFTQRLPQARLDPDRTSTIRPLVIGRGPLKLDILF